MPVLVTAIVVTSLVVATGDRLRAQSDRVASVLSATREALGVPVDARLACERRPRILRQASPSSCRAPPCLHDSVMMYSPLARRTS